MHGDIKESDGLCGLTRQSLSGQLNISMHVFHLKCSTYYCRCMYLKQVLLLLDIKAGCCAFSAQILILQIFSFAAYSMSSTMIIFPVIHLINKNTFYSYILVQWCSFKRTVWEL